MQDWNILVPESLKNNARTAPAARRNPTASAPARTHTASAPARTHTASAPAKTRRTPVLMHPDKVGSERREKKQDKNKRIKPIYYNDNPLLENVKVEYGSGHRNDCAIHALRLSLGIDMHRDEFRQVISEVMSFTTHDELSNMAWNIPEFQDKEFINDEEQFPALLEAMQEYVVGDTLIDVGMLLVAWPTLRAKFRVPPNVGALICNEQEDRLNICGYLHPEVSDGTVAACLVNNQENNHWMYGVLDGDSVCANFAFYGDNLEQIRAIFTPPPKPRH